MKGLLTWLPALALAATLHAQTPVPEEPTPAPGPAPRLTPTTPAPALAATTAAPLADASGNYTDEQLDTLVAPIALYPDPLVALILPAAAAPGDIALAARYLEANGDPEQADSQPWDDSVKALIHYPDVIRWMNENLDWTTALGHAFARQPVQVMQSVQQMRAEARASGALQDTPQQTVSLVGSTICIVPAQPDIIYVPQYDPAIVFVQTPVYYPGPIIVFGPPCRVGPWLRFRCDWDDYAVWVGVWQPGWTYVRQWRQPRGVVVVGRFWRPDPIRQRAVLRAPRPVPVLPRPRPMPGAPAVTPRPAPGARPPPTGVGRPDPRGWRTDVNGRPVVTPAPANPSRGRGGPSGPPSANRPPPPRSDLTPGRGPAPRPEPAPGPIIPAPPMPGPPNTFPPTPRPVPTSPGPRPRGPAAPPPAPRLPAPSAGPTQPSMLPQAQPVSQLAPIVAPPAPGPAFGTYQRGTATRDFSERGQASRAAAVPPPAPIAAPSPARVAAPPPMRVFTPGPRAAPSFPPSAVDPGAPGFNGRGRR